MIVQMDLFSDFAPAPASAGAGAEVRCAADVCAADSSVVSEDFVGERFAEKCHRSGFDGLEGLCDPCLKCPYKDLCDSGACAAHCFELDVNDPYEDSEDLYDF